MPPAAFPAAFNVTLIQPSGYAHSEALGEVWVYLADVLRRCGYTARCTRNRFVANEHNIVLCAHLLSPAQIPQLPPSTIIFNSEKLEHSDGWHFANGAYREILRRFPVWDYSSRNLALVPHDRKAQIPLYHSPALRRSHPRNPDGPLLFYGVITERRAAILQGIQNAGVQVGVLKFGCYGDVRDQVMLQCGAVLNLHTDNERKVFEPVRCFHPLINGVPVITEEFHDEPMFDVFRDSCFVTNNDPVVGIVRLLSDRPAFHAAAAERIHRFAAADPLPHVRAAVQAYLAGIETLQPTG